MKKLIMLITTLSTFYAHSQSFANGIYYTAKKDIGFESEIFEIKQGNEFNYALFGCLGSSFGTGIYKISQDSIHFFFDKMSALKSDEIQFKSTPSDSLKINIIVGEQNLNSTLPGVDCFFLNNEIGWQSDFNGLIKGKTVKRDSTRILRFQFIGFGNYDIEVGPNVSEITGFLKMDNINFYQSGKKMSLKLKAFNTRKFTLEISNKRDITYKRIHINKVSEIIKNRTNQSYEQIFNNK